MLGVVDDPAARKTELENINKRVDETNSELRRLVYGMEELIDEDIEEVE